MREEAAQGKAAVSAVNPRFLCVSGPHLQTAPDLLACTRQGEGWQKGGLPCKWQLHLLFLGGLASAVLAAEPQSWHPPGKATGLHHPPRAPH